MTRDAYSDRLLDLAYGELPKREAREVEAHAAACDACRAELARIRGTRRMMAALPDEAAPERGERILLAAAREAAEARRPRRLVPRWLLGGAVVAASVAVVAAVSLRVSEWTPRHAEEQSLVASPYATRPPETSAPAASTPAPAGAPGAEDGYARAPAVRDRAPDAKGARAEPGRVAAAPPRATRREPAPAAPPRAEELQAYASSPPPPPAAAGSGAPAEAEAEPGAARERAAEASGAAAAPAASRRMAAAPGQAAPAAAAAPPRGGVSAKQKAAAEPQPRAAYDVGLASDDAAPAPLRTEVRSFPGCAGEARRRVEVDARGRAVRYVREGTVGGRRLRIEHAFGPDGRPAGVTVTDLDAPGEALDPRALGLSLPARAEDAGIDAPPRCGR